MSLESARNLPYGDASAANALVEPDLGGSVPIWHSLRQKLTRRLAGEHDLRAVLKGATHVMAIRMGGAALAYISAIFLARWLGSFEFGIYAYVWVWMLILAAALPLGYSSSALRFLPDYLARHKWARLRGFIKESMLVSLGSSTLGALVGAGLVYVFQGWIEPYYVAPLLIGLLCLPATAVLNQLESTARAFGWLHLAFVPGYIVRPLILMAAVFVLFTLGFHPDAIDTVWALAAACVIGATGQWFLVRRGLRRVLPDVKPVQHTNHWAIISLSFVTIDGFRQVLENCDVLMIGRLLDPSSVAAYYAAIRTGGLIAFIYFAVVALAAPKFAKIHISGTREEMQRFVSGVIQLMFWPSLMAAAGLACLGPFILSLFGRDFADGYTSLLVVLAGLLVRAATGPVEYMLNMTGHHRDTIRVYGLSAVACVVLNIVLIPAFGIVGAAISSYASIAGANLWLSILVKRRLGIVAFLGIPSRNITIS